MQIDGPPIITIVIATKNRQKYAKVAIASILDLGSPDLELVVHDNSDSPELREFALTRQSDRRFKYIYHPEPLSAVANHNRALGMARGDYVCLIGDDDGINPEIAEIARWAQVHNFDSVSCPIVASYEWPVIDPNGASRPGSLKVSRFSSCARFMETKTELLKLMRSGSTSYLEFGLPKLYHGIVRRELLEVIREKCGSYIAGLCPDIFTAVALSCIIKRTWFVDFPLTIAGACSVSGSVLEGRVRKHSKKLEDAPHLKNFGVYSWSEVVPRIYCVECLWADSALVALRKMGNMRALREHNVALMAVSIIRANRQEAQDVIKSYLKTCRSLPGGRLLGILRLSIYFVYSPFRSLGFRVKRRLKILQGRYELVDEVGIADIHLATLRLLSAVKESGKSYHAVLPDEPRN